MGLMSKSALLAVTFSILVAAFMVPGSVSAQEKNVARPFVIAVIDMTRVQREAAAAKNVREQMDARRTQYQTEVQQEESKLRTAYQELTQKKSVLSADAFETERQKFEDGKVAAQRRMQGFRGELDKAGQRGRDAIVTKLHKVIENLVESKGITLLLRKSQLVFTATNYEVTDYVIQELDKALPTVDVFAPGSVKK